MKRFLGFGLMRIEGRSMAPTLKPGDYVVTRGYSARRPPAPGDVAVYRDKLGRTLVKRIVDRLDDGRYSVMGDGPLSAPRQDLGTVAEQDMTGRVLQVIRAPQR